VEETIRLTNLNREILILKRREIIEDFENLLIKQMIRFLKEKDNQNNLPSSIRLAFFVVFEFIENKFKDDQKYTLTAWWTWINIKEMLFKTVCKTICKDNREIEQLLDYALDLYINQKAIP
jgi:hypothetical protein